MSADISLMLQTVYAELLERVSADALATAFPDDGVFVAKSESGQRYWYFQASRSEGKKQRYVGKETPELLARIAAHRSARDDLRERRSLIATLVRVGNLPRPLPRIGDLLAALSREGVFRLRGVLVGTVAYQAYSAMLGVRLPAPLLQTGDVDIAQFADVSIRVGDRTRPALELLRQFDPSFQPVPHTDPARTVAYRAGQLLVEFLTPNRGRDTEQPEPLPAFGTDARPLRFLDFLIRDPEPAVLLHGAGILVSVPAPERFALHKLIVSRRRRDTGKREKDLLQAQALLDVLVRRRPHELATAWGEAFGRGRTWQRLLGEGLGLLHPRVRDDVLRAVGAPRAVVRPELTLYLIPSKAIAEADGDSARCFAVSRSVSEARAVLPVGGVPSGRTGIGVRVTCEALARLAGQPHVAAADGATTLQRHLAQVERAAVRKYLNGLVQADDELLLTSSDFDTDPGHV